MSLHGIKYREVYPSSGSSIVIQGCRQYAIAAARLRSSNSSSPSTVSIPSVIISPCHLCVVCSISCASLKSACLLMYFRSGSSLSSATTVDPGTIFVLPSAPVCALTILGCVTILKFKSLPGSGAVSGVTVDLLFLCAQRRSWSRFQSPRDDRHEFVHYTSARRHCRAPRSACRSCAVFDKGFVCSTNFSDQQLLVLSTFTRKFLLLLHRHDVTITCSPTSKPCDMFKML
nr:hypothetical protein CFP56_52209 [Quercus suber]